MSIIIVPIYNAQGSYRSLCEVSARQTYRNEILLLNDGSQDVSLEVCKMYTNVDPRIVLIDKGQQRRGRDPQHGPAGGQGQSICSSSMPTTRSTYATELLVQRAESGADLVIAHYNRITPPARAEDDPPAPKGADLRF